MKGLIIVMSLLFLGNCNAQRGKPIMPKKEKAIKIIPESACEDKNNIKYKKIVNWYKDGYLNKTSYYDFKNTKSISMVKKSYSIKNGLLYYKKRKVDSTEIYYRYNDSIDCIVWIRKGLPIKEIINIEGLPRPSIYSIIYKDSKTYYSFLEHNSYIENGNGTLKRFYYAKWNFMHNPQDYTKETIKEEGEVKNNFKYGEWKYYNKSGVIDSTKIYSLKDSVDVRFPHCIFNKKEPCYCEKK
ncbi:hypothetical protein FNW52_16330 [Flavobacterium sp. ZT3R18]|uniref:hypothetical protein n=1 Tax=Flavobacterium sp. ZT3R18 TaxID=2594429 RepID=UPI001179BEFE|nr:hypothetical protein [Flavobacterium sp. ZT3R18]TRX32724.1 hypothetical protein FNW52_16330 [Flavobacterium sp. ZT3R18]